MNKILIIDSNKDYHLIYRRKLRLLKFNLTFVCSVSEALDQLEKKDFDFVIIEHLLKKKSGVEVYDNLRESGYTGPIMVMTCANGVKREHYNGIVNMVHKSIDSKQLCDTILNLIYTEESEQPTQVRKIREDF